MAIGLHEILAIENEPQLLDYKCPVTGLLLWPMVRQQFLRCLISDLLYKSTPWFSTAHQTSYSVAIGLASRALLHNVLHARSGDILLIASGVGLFVRDNKFFNRLSDHFALAAPEQSVVLEDTFDYHWPYPRHNQRVIYHIPMQALCAVAGRVLMRKRHLQLANNVIELIRGRAKDLLDWDLETATATYLVRLLAYQAAQTSVKCNIYRKMLSRVGARLVIKEEGCYGHSGVFNATAREMGVIIAEYQHGTVSVGHDAYNLAPVLARSEAYRRTLPEYFLGYGEWWHDQINVPVSKVVIGNPHRTEQLAEPNSPSPDKTDILILGDGVETRMYLDLAHRLADSLGPAWRVVFRPHPMERSEVGVGDSIERNVFLDFNSDIYAAFRTAHAVVSEVSTGLFEAVGVADRILIWDTPKARFYYPEHPFAFFTDAADLTDKINDGKTGILEMQDLDRIWAPNWKENYLRFIDERIGN